MIVLDKVVVDIVVDSTSVFQLQLLKLLLCVRKIVVVVAVVASRCWCCRGESLLDDSVFDVLLFDHLSSQFGRNPLFDARLRPRRLLMVMATIRMMGGLKKMCDIIVKTVGKI